ncbi:MAG TPA: hypothetical protein VGM18_11625 [Candidatus Sulfotelmatobacter sp.]|jgi:hypothetical protein
MKREQFGPTLLSVCLFCADLRSGIRAGIPRADKFLYGAGLLLCLESPSLAQVDRAGLTGTVTDPSGRVMTQTQVTAMHPQPPAAGGLERCNTERERFRLRQYRPIRKHYNPGQPGRHRDSTPRFSSR